MLRTDHPRLARGWLCGVLLLGALFGLAQLVRGAHFPSHTFWTAWFCWAICWAGQGLWRVTAPDLPR